MVLKWLERAGNGRNGWKGLEMAKNGWINNQWDGLMTVLTVSFLSIGMGDDYADDNEDKPN